MKKYRFKYSIFAIVLISVCMAGCIFCVVWNAIKMIKSPFDEYNASYTLAILFSFVVFLAFASALSFAFYTVKDNKIFLRISIINTGTPLDAVTEIVRFPEEKRLSIIFKDGQYSNIVISPEKFNEFIEEVKKTAKHITVRVCSDETK